MEKGTLLTFEISNDHQQLHIFGNRQGLSSLICKLAVVLKAGDHDHLMTPSWAGQELTETLQASDTKILNKVTIHFIEKA